jgi:hypothetical protein
MSAANPQQQPLTDTEEAMIENFGLDASLPYALRADQLDDGAFRYALEDARTGETLAEGIDPDEHAALGRFRESLAQSRLSRDEIEALQTATRQYDRTA